MTQLGTFWLLAFSILISDVGYSASAGSAQQIQELIKLQRRERQLGAKRLKDLEEAMIELDSRRGLLRERIEVQKQTLKQFLVAIDRSSRDLSTVRFMPLQSPEDEKIDAPRRRMMANLVARGLRELRALRADLSDAENLESRIVEERRQIAYLLEDLREQENILELNRRIREDFLKQKRNSRVAGVDQYRKLRAAEAHVEGLIGEFNAKVELERAAETEKSVARAMATGVFHTLKGKLTLPVRKGKVVSAFGRVLDPKSNLYIFRKGIEIQAGKKDPVHAVSPGKVAFSGELQDYGRVAIIDHGDHYYSLCAHLGQLLKKQGDVVAAGEPVGATDDLGTPVYFEIRSRDVAVNPLQWLSN